MAPKTPAAAKKDKDTNSHLPPALAAVLAQIQKEFGEGAIMRLGNEGAIRKIPSISTSALTLDMALGIGGVPRGRIIELFGPESSGKTTLVLHIIAEAQKNGGLCAFIDTEHALDPGYARKIGVDIDNLLVSQPDSGEEALIIADQLIRSNSLDVLVIDSVAALAPRAEIEGQIGDSHVGLQARLMSQAMRKMTSIIDKSKTCCIFTNQIREKIGVMFGNPETTPGGRALKFYSSVRLDIRRIAAIKSGDGKVVGNRTRVKVVKNKVAPPFTEAEFDILYAEGISREGAVIDAANDLGLLDKRGTWLSYEGQQLGQGRDAARENLRHDTELLAKLRDAVIARHAEHGAKPSGKEVPRKSDEASAPPPDKA
ncbi:MAG: recombinase RecA [Lentisphaerae bacterium]|nr:recombinase RecA [Lentisphaerota bacterium]